MEKPTILTIVVLGVMFCVPRVSEAEPMGTTFTYQGRLIDANEAADGEYDFEFTLYDANTDGNQIGWAATIADVDVVDGYFTVELFLGSASFDGDARWLEIGVRPGEVEDPNVYTILEPRQEVTPTPYAIYARMAGTDNDWMVSDSNMYSIPPGNVGIGTTTPQEKLTVVDGTIKCTNSSDGGWAVQGEASGWYGQGVYGYGTGYGGRGVYGKAGEDFGMGVYGKAIAEGQVSNWGGYFSAAGDFGTGVYGHASASGDVLNFGGYFEAAGDQGRGVYGKGTGYGGYFIGDNDMVGQDSYGLYTEATGLEGDRYGLYSKVTTSNGPLNFNWGGYAEVANNDGGSVGYHADLTPGESGWGMSVGLHTTAANTDNQTGLYSSVSHRGTEGKVYGVLAATFSSDSGESYAGYFDSRSYPGDTGDLYGIKALCGNDTSGSKYAGYFTKDGGGNYAGYFSGNVHVSGTLTATSKPFIQPHKSDPSKEVVYASLEGPEHTVFIRGKAGCQNGVAVIKMPEYWQQVAAEHDITVNLTPMGAWAGLYVQSASNREVVVRVAGGGAENAQFCYYITAPRAGFEEHEPIQENTHFTADGTSAGDFESRYTEDTLDNKAIRAMLQANGILTADGKLNMDTVGRLGWTVNAENAEPILPKRHQFAHAAGVKY